MSKLLIIGIAVLFVVLGGIIIFAHRDEREKHIIQLLAVIGMIFGVIHDKWYTETPWDKLEAYELLKGEYTNG